MNSLTIISRKLTQCRCKGETKEEAHTPFELTPTVEISQPTFDAAKKGGILSKAEPEGYIITLNNTSAPKLKFDLKVKSEGLDILLIVFVFIMC